MLNSIVIQGRIVHTPELRQTQGGTSVLGMSVAVQRSRKDQDGNYPTDFFECTFWGKLAENAAKFFHKGDQIIVRGRMESRKYEDKNGNKRELHLDLCAGDRNRHADTQATARQGPENGLKIDLTFCQIRALMSTPYEGRRNDDGSHDNPTGGFGKAPGAIPDRQHGGA